MFRPIAAYIGLRNVSAKNSNAFISFISLISMLGVILGVAVLILVLSVMNGFEQQTKIKILGILPQVAVFSPNRLPDWQDLAIQAQQQDSNIQTIAPFSRTQCMVSTPQGGVFTILLTGIVPEYEKKLSIVDDQMIEGNFESLSQQKNNIIIGKALAESLKIKLGDQITVILPQGTNSASGVIPRYTQFTVSGIYKLRSDPEKIFAYAPMETVNAILNQPQGAQGLRFKLKDVFKAPQTAEKAIQLNQGLTAQNWTMTNGNMFKILRMQKTMIAMILAFIILVAGFNLVSSLIMMVTERTSEIAILKTIGASRNLIVKIFIFQGSIIAIIGTLTGGLLGLGLAMSIGTISRWVNTTFNLDLFGTYFVTELPSNPQAGEILLVIIGSTLVAVLATIYPAYKAANIQPVQGLKAE